MQHIGAHLRKTQSNDRRTERGELMRYFCRKVNIDRIRDNYPKVTMAHMGKVLQGIPTKDLYYLKRVCEESKNFSKRFWWELDPAKHPKE